MYTYLILAIVIILVIYLLYTRKEPFCYNCAPASKNVEMSFPISASKRTVGAPVGTCCCRPKHHNRWSIYKRPRLCGKMWETRFPNMKCYRYSYKDLPPYKYKTALRNGARLHALPLNLKNIWRANVVN